MRVVLADDHQLVRAGLCALLQSFADVQVLAECGDGHEALALVDRMQPDVLLLDIALPGLNGLDVAARVPKLSPRTRVLILSMHTGAEYVGQALRAGVAGYLVKDSAVDELRVALDSLRAGRPYLSPGISQAVLQGYLRTGQAPPERAALDPLTSRQRETLQLIAEGHSTREIAARLGVSVKTVESHRSQLMHRLDIHDVAGLVRFAIRAGLVSADST